MRHYCCKFFRLRLLNLSACFNCHVSCDKSCEKFTGGVMSAACEEVRSLRHSQNELKQEAAHALEAKAALEVGSL